MKKKRTKTTRWQDRLAPTLLVWAVVGYLGLNLGRLVIQEGRLLYQGRILAKDRESQGALREKLMSQIADAKSAHGVEHLARRALALARPGEVQVVFIPGAQARLAPYPVPPTPDPATP